MAGGMRICPDCGREWSEKVIFCMGCGARTVEKTEEVLLSLKESEAEKETFIEKDGMSQIDLVPKKEAVIEKESMSEIDLAAEKEVAVEKDSMKEVRSQKPVLRKPVFTSRKNEHKEDKLPDIEELILAYIRKVKDQKESKAFIDQIRKML